MARLPYAARVAVDSLYVSLGFGVLGFQKAQVRRRELERDVDRRRVELGAEGPLGTVDAGVDVAIDQLVAVLPSPVDDALDATRLHARRALSPACRGPLATPGT